MTMKTSLLSLLLVLTGPILVQAEKVGTITTLLGKTYRDCEITKVYPDGVSFRHRNGAAKILFEDLSQSWRQRLGYNSERAAAYERDMAERKERQAAARAAQRAEASRALFAAHEAQIAQLRLAERQVATQVAASPAWSYSGFPIDASFYGAASPIGATFRGSGVYRHRGTSWSSSGLVSLGSGSGGVVAFPSGGIQYYRPGMHYSPTLGYYTPAPYNAGIWGAGIGFGGGFHRPPAACPPVIRGGGTVIIRR